MANGIANIDAQEGTLVGVAHNIHIGGFIPMSVEVYNFDAVNSYTLVFQAQGGTTTITIPPQFKFGIQGPLTDLTLTGTGAWKVVTFNTLLPAPGGFSSLYGVPPSPSFADVKSIECPVGGPGAGVDLAAVSLWKNNSHNDMQIMAVRLLPRTQVTTLGGGETCLIEIFNTSTGGQIMGAVIFDDNPGGDGVNWPGYSANGGVHDFALNPAPDSVVLASEQLILTATQSVTANTGDYVFQIDYRIL